MVSTKEQEKDEERRRRLAQEEELPVHGNAAIDPELLWSSRKDQTPQADQDRINNVFARLDPEEERQHQSYRIHHEMKELEVILRERFEELFRLIEQMNIDKVKVRSAAEIIEEQNKSNRGPELKQLSQLATEIQSHLSKGLVAIIPDLPGVTHFESNVIVLPIARNNVGAEEISTPNSSFSIEVSSHESLGAAVEDRTIRNLMGALSDLSTTVGFAIQGLMIADDSEAISMRDELILRQGQLRIMTDKFEEVLNDVNEPLLMLFDAMDTQKKENAA